MIDLGAELALHLAWLATLLTSEKPAPLDITDTYSGAINRIIATTCRSAKTIRNAKVGRKTQGKALVARMRRRSACFLTTFWNADSLAEVARYLDRHTSSEPFAYVAQHTLTSAPPYAAYNAHCRHEVDSAREFLIRSMRPAIDEATASLEWGLTVLALIASPSDKSK